MRIRNFLKFVYNGLLTGLPSLTYNPFTRQTFVTEFNVQPFSTYINYKIDMNNFKKINEILDNDSIFNLEKVKLEKNNYDYYLSVNVYNCSLPIIPTNNDITRLEINTYVVEKDNNQNFGTLLLDYLSNELSMDPVNIFKQKEKGTFYFKKNNNDFLVYSNNSDININCNFRLHKNSKNLKISNDLLKFSDNIYYKNGIYDKLFYDSSLTYPSIKELEVIKSEFTFNNITFDKPDFVFTFENKINFCGGMWKNVYD